MSVVFKIESEQEVDGRYIAEIIELPGVLAYGSTESEAVIKAKALALRVIADRIEHNEHDNDYETITFDAA